MSSLALCDELTQALTAFEAFARGVSNATAAAVGKKGGAGKRQSHGLTEMLHLDEEGGGEETGFDGKGIRRCAYFLLNLTGAVIG